MAPTTTAADPTAAVLAVYQRYWQLWLDDNNPPNPDDPRLAQVESPQALAITRASMQAYSGKGEVVVLPANPRYHHQATATIDPTGTRALVRDCALDDSVLEVAATGATVNADIETQLIVATISQVDGVWMVDSAAIQQTWPGVRSC